MREGSSPSFGTKHSQLIHLQILDQRNFYWPNSSFVSSLYVVYTVKSVKRIQVRGKAALKLRKIADAKAAKVKALKQKPKKDLSKMPIVG